MPRKKKIDEALEKMSPDGAEQAREILEYMKQVVEKYGDTPPAGEEPGFYSALEMLLRLFKDEGVQVHLKDVANYLRVDYNKLRKYRSDWRKSGGAEELEEALRQQAALPDAVQASPQPQASAPVSPLQSVLASMDTDTIKRETQRQIEKKIADVVKKRVEDVIKEDVELIYRIGKVMYTKWRGKCFAEGKTDLVSCLDEAVDFYFNNKSRIDMLESELKNCKNTVKTLLVLSKPEIARMVLIREAQELLRRAAWLSPSQQRRVVDQVLSLLERLALQAG